MINYRQFTKKKKKLINKYFFTPNSQLKVKRQNTISAPSHKKMFLNKKKTLDFESFESDVLNKKSNFLNMVS